MGFLNVDDPEVGVAFCGEKVGKVEKISRGLGYVSQFPKVKLLAKNGGKKKPYLEIPGQGWNDENTYGSMR